MLRHPLMVEVGEVSWVRGKIMVGLREGERGGIGTEREREREGEVGRGGGREREGGGKVR